MRRLLALLAACLLLANATRAQDAFWIEVEGMSFVSGGNDVDSARRRALADALLNAALAGGAIIQGHTVVNLARVERDLLIARPTGRVLRYEQLGAGMNGDMWTVRIRALVGNGGLTSCSSPNTLHITAYRPEVNVSPYAPAWSEPLAGDVIQNMYAVLDRHPATGDLRITDRPLNAMSQARASRDYNTILNGDVRTSTGDYGFLPQITITTGADGRSEIAQLNLVLNLLDAENNVVTRQELVRTTRMPGPSLLGNAAVLTQNNRREMVDELTKGLSREFDALLSVQSCTPLAATVVASGNDLAVQVGSRHGLTRGAIAFTADNDHSVEMLEVVQASNCSAVLRPMDPTQSPARFVGRPVRFIEGGL